MSITGTDPGARSGTVALGVHDEISPLRAVLVHRPWREL